jgi:hypothetical protein
MSFTINRVNYFYITIKDQPGEAYQMLQQLAGLGINLLAFSAIPVGPATTQLTIFPDDSFRLENLAKKSGLTLLGPHQAFIVQGKDELGALAQIHETLYSANVNVYASNGVSDGKSCYGYIIYVKADDYERAANALGV